MIRSLEKIKTLEEYNIAKKDLDYCVSEYKWVSESENPKLEIEEEIKACSDELHEGMDYDEELDLLEKIHAHVQVPLVLHGGSGIPEDDVRKAINGGIRKVNVGTHIRYTYVKSVGEAIQEKGPATHTADIMEVAKKNVKEVLYDWMRICSNK